MEPVMSDCAQAVFLDRDGVINRAVIREGRPYPPRTLAELEIDPDTPVALARLKEAGFKLIVVTNQPDVARGTQTRAEVERMHRFIQRQLNLDAFEVCYHDDADGCECRKPKPGLLFQAAQRYALKLAECYLIGDRWRDIEAGQRAGCQALFIDYQYAESKPQGQFIQVDSLTEAINWILIHRKPHV